MPLSHPPGEAQVDFGFADVWLNGELTQVALFVMTLPYSDAIYLQAFPRECTEVFLEGHVRAFAFFGGVPMRTDAIRLILEYQQEQPVDLFCLEGRPHLKLVRVAQTNVAADQALIGGGA